MMSFRLDITPADELVIRDGRPFNQSDAGRAVSASLFPPPPDTVYGAIRAGLARGKGWNGVSDWTGDKRFAALGSWRDPGQLRVSGPFFTLDGEALLPAPANLYVRSERSTGQPEVIYLAMPGDPLASDAGAVRFPEPPLHEVRWDDATLFDRYLPAGAVRRLLAGDSVTLANLQVDGGIGVATATLAPVRHQTGIERDATTRLARDGLLYVQARRGFGRGVSMYAEVEAPDDLRPTAPIAVPIGGEGRFAYLEARDCAPPLPPSPIFGAYCLMLTTPALAARPIVGEPFAGLPGRLVSAALSGVTTTAGYERRPKGVGLQEARLRLPPGTMLFFEHGAGHPAAAIGDCTERGYGRFIIGRWNDG